ncbi:hypothetical protein V493_04171 [Pseudogymnoascus sp. VKM F-4281 (FW-2241)]|nr:hypothetical protein V493_04171 [Pseudogymnoascus sp. VKM F-4281 (FW-2241)]
MAYYETNPRRNSLLGHLSFGVKSMSTCEPFYDAILAPFGIVQVFRNAPRSSAATTCGWGYGSSEPFTLFESPEAAPHGKRTHLAFNAPSRVAVKSFYEAALKNGGTSDGEPGLRTLYGENYYACFVFDPEGHRLEAVFQDPEAEQQ